MNESPIQTNTTDAGRRRPGGVRVALVHQPLELRVVEVDDVDPDLQHIVDAALAEADPHARMRDFGDWPPAWGNDDFLRLGSGRSGPG